MVAALALSLALLAPLTAAAGPVTPVLVLNSYHPGFTWTDKELKGIREGFLAEGASVELQIEYLDAKRHPEPEVRTRMEDLLRAKLRSPFPVVLATDNAALEFALDVRPRLFPGAVVVFCGLNGPPETTVRGRPRVTGVLERWDPGGTLRAVARIQPGVRDILVVHDQTESGIGTRADLEAAAEEFRDRFRFEFLPPQPLEATLQRVATLPDRWAVLLLGYNVDADGQVLDSARTGPLLAGRSRVPVYTMDETRFSGGVVGGSLLSGGRQGEMAARLAARILAGTSVEALPIVRDPVAVLRFDYQALRRFGIRMADLPEGSVVVNLPTSFVQQHLYEVIGSAAFVIALIVFSVVLASHVMLRRRAEEALRSSEESLRITLDSIGDGVIATDARGGVVRLNPAAESLTGWTLQEARGRALGEVYRVDPDDVSPAREGPVERALREDKPVTAGVPSRLVARDGAVRLVADSAAPIRSREGLVVGAVLVFRDTTAEHALQERLRQSQRMEVVGQLAGGVAHDFNNILTAILGTAQLLADQLVGRPEERELSEELVSATLRAAELTRQLLAFSRKGPLQMIPLRAHDLVDGVTRLLARSIDKRILIVKDLRAERDSLLGDPALLQSALLNLGVNGRDAMPEGGTLTFATSTVSMGAGEPDIPAGEYLSLTVSDTGAGMSAEVRSRLFEPYFTTKPLGQGTGLGLASVYGCVKSHQGHISVKSELGRGSSFRLLLPLLREEATAAQAVDQGVIHGEGRILVIDDEEIVRNTVTRMLRGMGYQVVACGDGHEAVEHYRNHPGQVDLVILDMVMPHIGGREVFYLLKAIDPAVRVILASGFTQHQVTDELLADGAKGFIGKPMRAEDLSRQVRAAIGTREKA